MFVGRQLHFGAKWELTLATGDVIWIITGPPRAGGRFSMNAGLAASLIFFALLVGFIVLGWIVSAGAPKRRRRALEAVAAEIGFSFVADKPNYLPGLRLPGAGLDWQAANCTASNFMEGTLSGMRTAIFDYFYYAGPRFCTFHTVALFASTQRVVPSFDLRRKLLLQPYSNRVELSAPEFSKHFALMGADHDWLRRMFDRQVIDLIASAYARQHFQLRGGGPWLAFMAVTSTRQSRLKPQKWPGFIQDVSQIAAAVFERARAEHTAAA